MMKKYRLFPAICLVAALLLSACSQDELAENSTALPEGEYPLQIGSVTLTAEVSEQPWTRVSENPTDGMSSVWANGDRIGVRIGDNEETGIYVVNVDETTGNISVTPEKAVYWKDKQPATITAWYPVKEELDFTHQDQGLTYLLKATGNGDYQSTPINLNFIHQLAKVRVKLEGTKANEVTAVTVRSYPTSTHAQGALNQQDTSLPTSYVPMREATYNGVKYWEANLRPGTLQTDKSFQVAKAEGDPVRVTLDADVPITAGQVHTITITVNSIVPDNATIITDNTGNITDNGEYVVRGSDHTTSINITGGSPTIYLDGATVSIGDGNAINITNNATPTIYVVGEGNTISSSNGAGIYVEKGNTVTITGSSRNDELTVTGGNARPGIGGYVDDNYSGVDCGDITISNITVSANGSGDGQGNASPGIGCVGTATCGTITISNATIYASGINDNDYISPGIGSGFTTIQNPVSIPNVIASNSEIHVHRGSPGSTCDYIGWAVFSAYPSHTAANSAINPGAGSITGSTVYCYTGDTLDKTVEYDENGIDTEQSQ